MVNKYYSIGESRVVSDVNKYQCRTMHTWNFCKALRSSITGWLFKNLQPQRCFSVTCIAQPFGGLILRAFRSIFNCSIYIAAMSIVFDSSRMADNLTLAVLDLDLEVKLKRQWRPSSCEILAQSTIPFTYQVLANACH